MKIMSKIHVSRTNFGPNHQQFYYFKVEPLKIILWEANWSQHVSFQSSWSFWKSSKTAYNQLTVVQKIHETYQILQIEKKGWRFQQDWKQQTLRYVVWKHFYQCIILLNGVKWKGGGEEGVVFDSLIPKTHNVKKVNDFLATFGRDHFITPKNGYENKE